MKITDEAGHGEIETIPIQEGEFYTLHIEKNIADFSDWITISYRVVDGTGNPTDVEGVNKFMVMNPQTTGARPVAE